MQHNIGYMAFNCNYITQKPEAGIENLRLTQPTKPQTASTNQTNNKKIKFMIKKIQMSEKINM